MSKNKWRTICVIAILMSLLLACSAFFFNVQKPAFAQEEASYGVDNGRYDEYTDDKEKNGVDILEYPSYYAKGITFSDEDKGGYMPCYMHFSGDDKIVDFVPRELFAKVGKTFYIGKTYGFIVDTFAVENSDALHSIVMLFRVKVEDNIIETRNHIKVKIQPVFQGEFCYFDNNAEMIANRMIYHDTVRQTIKYRKNYANTELILVNEGAQQENYVVAVPFVHDPELGRFHKESFEFRETKKYYLSNVSGMMSLYNENHLNVGDAGYNAENDDGAFFSQADYAYSGHYYNEKELSSAGSLLGTFTSIALDFASALIPGSQIALHSIIKLAEAGLTAADIINGAKEIEQSEKMVSTEKKLTYVPDYTTKDQQLLFNNCLNRDMVIAVESGDEKQLLLDSGDYVELDFQVSTTDTAWATRYILGVAMDAVPLSEEEEDVTLQSETVGYSDSIVFTGNETFELTANAENNNYAFFDSVIPYVFTPPYSGEYVFSADGKIEIYDGNDSLVASSETGTLNAELQEGAIYRIKQYRPQIEDNGKTLSLTVDFSPESIVLGNNSISMKGNSVLVVKLPQGTSGQVYKISKAGDLVFTPLDYNFNLCEIEEHGEYYEFVCGDAYYLRIDNTSNEQFSGVFAINKGDSLICGQTTDNVIVDSVKYFNFTPNYTGYYMLNCSQNDISLEIIGELEYNGEYLLEAGKLYAGKAEGVGTVALAVDYAVKEAELGTENILLTSDRYYQFVKFTAPISLTYDFTVNNGFIIAEQIGADAVINSTSLSLDMDKDETVIFNIKRTEEGLVLNFGCTFDVQEITVGEKSSFTHNADGYKVLKFQVDQTAYYDIDHSQIELYNSAFQEITYSDAVYLSNGTYYVKVFGAAGKDDSLTVFLAAEDIQPLIAEMLNKTSYFRAELLPNTSYIFETFGGDNASFSTGIKIVSPAGEVLKSASFEEYGTVSFDNTDYESVFVVVETEENLLGVFGFRMLFRNENEIPEEYIVTLNISDEFAVTPGRYIRIEDLESDAYVFLRKSSSLSNEKLMKVNSNGTYSEVDGVIAFDGNEMLKYSVDKNGGVYFIDNGADILYEIAVYPQQNNFEIFAYDAQGEAVEQLLRGNTYTFRLVYNEELVNSTNVQFKVFVESKEISKTVNYNFYTYTVGSEVSVMGEFYDYQIDQLTFELGYLYDFNTNYDVTTDEEDILNFVYIVNCKDNGADGTAAIEQIDIIFKDGENNVLREESVSIGEEGGNKSFDIVDLCWNEIIQTTIKAYHSGSIEFVEEIGIGAGNQRYQNERVVFSDVSDNVNLPFVYLNGDTKQEVGKDITISSTVKMINIEGINGTVYSNLSFIVAHRDTPLLVNMKNMNFTSNNDDLFAKACFSGTQIDFVLRCYGSNKMQVETTKYGEDTISFGWGNVYIFGGDAQASLEVIGADGGDGTVYGIADSGQAAISANNIYISIYKFIASGGDGGDGAQGEKGADAKDYTYIGEPGNPGKAGENGSSAIFGYNIIIENVAVFQATGGNGGAGGQGGAGGNGAKGVDSSVKKGTGGTGSVGGTGGIGGVGGNGGAGIEAVTSLKMENIGEGSFLKGGDAGLAGKGGTGGTGGAGGKGGPGKALSRKGGTGGIGGRGGDGGHGGRVGIASTGLILNLQAQTNEFCQAGAANNSSEILNQARGEGGAGGAGGIGGDPASNIFAGTGERGDSGKPGNPGEVGDPGYISL